MITMNFKELKMMKKVLMVISILAAVAMAVLNLTYQFGPEPDVEYPMANQKISWLPGK